jgi:nicotinamide riboside transporter PnuC
MSTTPPPDQPEGGTTRQSMGMPSMPTIASGARMPIPGNAEFALWLAVEIVFIVIWISAKSVNTAMWVQVTTVLTAFYLISRGIAKASRVLEQ